MAEKDKGKDLAKTLFEEISTAAKAVSGFYDQKNGLREKLNGVCNEIRAGLNAVVDKNAKDYQLVHENAASKKIVLYALTSRVKESSSLYEKFIRNQQYHFINELSEEAILANNDDIIGLRYLVSLSCDCESIFQLICAHKAELEQEGITFSNLDNNPEKMNNGRQIYRLKGKYQGYYPFELQIKSKIDSAWADEEHMLFYKEHDFSYTQKANREAMTQIGNILEEMDHLMVKIRNCQDTTAAESEKLEFYKKIQDRYEPLLIKYLTSAFVLKEQRETIYSFFLYGRYMNRQQASVWTLLEETTRLESFQTLEKNAVPEEKLKSSNIWQNYQAFKVCSIEYILFEHIYADWMQRWHAKKSPLTSKEFIAYFCDITRFFVQTNLKKMLPGDEESVRELTEFAKWTADRIKRVFSQNAEMTFAAPLFLTDKVKLYMLLSYLRARKTIIEIPSSADSARQAAKRYLDSIDALVVSFMLMPDKKEDIAGELKRTRNNISKNPRINPEDKTALFNILEPGFAEIIKSDYSKKTRTNSGKKLQANQIVELFEV